MERFKWRNGLLNWSGCPSINTTMSQPEIYIGAPFKGSPKLQGPFTIVEQGDFLYKKVNIG